jgi:hypothetical protein
MNNIHQGANRLTRWSVGVLVTTFGTLMFASGCGIETTDASDEAMDMPAIETDGMEEQSGSCVCVDGQVVYGQGCAANYTAVCMGATTCQCVGGGGGGGTPPPSNVWTQHPFGTYGTSAPNHIYAINMGTTFVRYSGDLTRGGGTCLVLKRTSGACTQDSTCITEARNHFGEGAWGYCYNGMCYNRPGLQANFCTLNPNRSPGTYYSSNVTTSAFNNYYSNPYMLGCMTKTAGPNTACGGTDPTKYEKVVIPLTYQP